MIKVIHRLSTLIFSWRTRKIDLKVVSTTFVLVYFLSLNESTCQSKKKFFISLQKLFSFSRKSNFRILHFQISWCHQMPKHKTRNTLHLITWEVNSLLMKFSQFMSYSQTCIRQPLLGPFKNGCLGQVVI